jgi:type 1 glutamine amidotransferase
MDLARWRCGVDATASQDKGSGMMKKFDFLRGMTMFVAHLSGGITILAMLIVMPAGLSGAEPTVAPPLKRLLLLGQGPDGHPPQTHEFVAGLKLIKTCLDRVEGVEATLVDAGEPWSDGPDLIDKADGVVIFLAEGAKWIQKDEARLSALKRLEARGGAITGLHWGLGTKEAKNIAEYVALVGGCHGGPDRKYAIVEARTEIAAPKHPIMTAVEPLAIRDEFYFRLKFAKPEKDVMPLLRVPIEGESRTVAWAWERGTRGRSFGFSGLHFHNNWQFDGYRRMVVQGIAWTMRHSIPEQGLNVEVEPEALRLP